MNAFVQLYLVVLLLPLASTFASDNPFTYNGGSIMGMAGEFRRFQNVLRAFTYYIGDKN